MLLWFVNISAGNLCLYDFGGDAARIAGIEEPVALTTHRALYFFFSTITNYYYYYYDHHHHCSEVLINRCLDLGHN